MPNKILIITDNLRNQINGVVTTYTNIEKYADCDGYHIVYLDPSQFPHRSCPGYPEVKLTWPRSLGEKIKALDPDHIHIATEGPLGLAARLYCNSQKYRYNTAYHTKFPEFLYTMYRIPQVLTYMYLRWFHKDSKRVITTTDTMVNLLKSKKFKNNVISWTRGIDREVLKPTAERQPNSRPVVLYAGRVSKEKNIEAVCELENFYDINIVGDGPQRRDLEQVYKNVTFHGYLQGHQLADQFQRADVFAFPSRSDTFGIVIIEAMSVGTPVAAYDVDGPRDIIQNGINGYIGTDLKQNIEDCLRLDRNVVSQSSEKYTWQRCWDIFKSNLVNKLI